MVPESRVPSHPGEILSEEFLRPLHVSVVALAEHICVSRIQIDELINGKRNVAPDVAWLLSQAFGTTPQFWLKLQMNHDLALNRPKRQIEAFAI